MINYWWVTRPKRKLNSVPEVLTAFAEIFLRDIAERYGFRQFAELIPQDSFVCPIDKVVAGIHRCFESGFSFFFVKGFLFIGHTCVVGFHLFFESIPFLLCAQGLKTFECRFHFWCWQAIIPIYHSRFFKALPVKGGRLIIHVPNSL